MKELRAARTTEDHCASAKVVRTLAELRSIDSELERLSRTTDLIDEQETDSYDWYRDSPNERIRQAAQCFLGGYVGYLKAMRDMNFRAEDGRDNWELTADKRKKLDRLEFEVIGRGYCLLQDALEDRR